MDPLLIIVLLVVVAAILIVGDLFLPSAGIMSVVGVGLLLTAVIVCFTINQWLGLGALFALVIAGPFVALGMIRAWQATPIGRRMVLTENLPPPPPTAVVRVGATGRTLSTLRPMGECEFHTDLGAVPVQCMSEFGDLPPGVAVRVTHFHDGVATVRALPPELPASA